MTDLRRIARSLLAGRAAVVGGLFVAAVVIQLSTGAFLPLGPFYFLILAEFASGLAFLLLYLLDRHYRAQAWAQIAFDLLIVTSLVYISGGIGGQLFFLYIFVIIAAGLSLGGKAAVFTAAVAAILFGALADGLTFGLIPYFRPEQEPESGPGLALYTIFTAWVLFFAIAAMIGRLSAGLRRARAALDDAQREIEIRERQSAAGKASALVAHEIRNPLAAISGSVQVLRRELDLTPDQAHLMDIVVKESSRVSQSIEQFLSLASPAKETFSMFRLGETVGETLTMLKMSGGLDPRVEIHGNYAESDIEFFGSPSQFKQVFWNLIRNALRAMPDGGVLSIDFFPKRRGELLIRVADTGCGMSAEDQARMFQPFYTRFEGGRGLGLAVVRQILEGYGGRIRVLSEPRVGTDIAITLPLRAPKKAAKDEEAGAKDGVR